jgi:hypothetical protein
MRRFAFEKQDEPMIRAQQRIIDMTPPDELRRVTLETDLGVIRWRRIMEKMIAAERGRAA